MKITICGSLNFTHEIDNLRKKLEELGHDVTVPISSEKILKGEFSLDEIKREKEEGKFSERAIKMDAIRVYFEKIQEADAIVVANFDKKDISHYIGGNSFLEMGFAHVLNKKIFLLYPIPSMIYKDELEAMQPVILDGDFSKIS